MKHKPKSRRPVAPHKPAIHTAPPVEKAAYRFEFSERQKLWLQRLRDVRLLLLIDSVMRWDEIR